MKRAPLLLALCLAAPAGCALAPSQDSVHVSTLDVDIQVDAADDGAVTTVSIELDSPIGDVHLTGGDELRLTAGGEARALAEERDGRTIHYVSRFGDLDGVFHIDLIRPHDRSLMNVELTMPPSFSLAVPDAPAAGPIALTWDASSADHTLDLAISGACVRTLSRTLAADTGSYTVDPAELAPQGDGGLCPLDVSLTRTITASGPLLPEGLDAGSLSAHAVQKRTVTIGWGP